MANLYCIYVAECDTFDGSMFGGYRFETSDVTEYQSMLADLDAQIFVDRKYIAAKNQLADSLGEECDFNFPSIKYTTSVQEI